MVRPLAQSFLVYFWEKYVWYQWGTPSLFCLVCRQSRNWNSRIGKFR